MTLCNITNFSERFSSLECSEQAVHMQLEQVIARFFFFFLVKLGSKCSAKDCKKKERNIERVQFILSSRKWLKSTYMRIFRLRVHPVYPAYL